MHCRLAVKWIDVHAAVFYNKLWDNTIPVYCRAALVSCSCFRSLEFSTIHQSSPSLTVFRHRLKTFLFHKSFPTFYSFAVHALVVSVIVHYLSHGKNHDWLTDWSIPLRYDTIRKINVRSKADEMASSSLNKTCQLDPAPTWLIKEQRSLLSPFIALLFNKSLATAVSQRSTDMPSSFRY